MSSSFLRATAFSADSAQASLTRRAAPSVGRGEKRSLKLGVAAAIGGPGQGSVVDAILSVALFEAVANDLRQALGREAP